MRSREALFSVFLRQISRGENDASSSTCPTMLLGLKRTLREGLPFLRWRLRMRKNDRMKRSVDRRLTAMERNPEAAPVIMQRLLRSMTAEDLWCYYLAGPHYRIPWRGMQMTKFPADLMIYQALIDETRPEVLIEIGTQRGASALFFASLMEPYGGRVITLDLLRPAGDMVEAFARANVTFVRGDATAPEIAARVSELVRGKRCLVLDDGSHRATDVLAAFERYQSLVPSGGYYVIEDGMSWQICATSPRTALTAVDTILRTRSDWRRDMQFTPFLFFTAVLGVLRRT